MKFIHKFINLHINGSDNKHYYVEFCVTIQTILELIKRLEQIKKDFIKKYLAIGAATKLF